MKKINWIEKTLIFTTFQWRMIKYKFYLFRQGNKCIPYQVKVLNTLPFGKPLLVNPIVCKYPHTHDVDYAAYCVASQNICKALFLNGLWNKRNSIVFTHSAPYVEGNRFIMNVYGYQQ